MTPFQRWLKQDTNKEEWDEIKKHPGFKLFLREAEKFARPTGLPAQGMTADTGLFLYALCLGKTSMLAYLETMDSPTTGLAYPDVTYNIKTQLQQLMGYSESEANDLIQKYLGAAERENPHA